MDFRRAEVNQGSVEAEELLKEVCTYFYCPDNLYLPDIHWGNVIFKSNTIPEF